jgi:hypothetical protein
MVEILSLAHLVQLPPAFMFQSAGSYTPLCGAYIVRTICMSVLVSEIQLCLLLGYMYGPL